MNNLEFIEKEIKELEFQINYIKSNMEKYIDFRTEGQLEVDMKQLKLKHLQQVKSELEAWEELTTLFYITIDNFGNLYISLGEETVDTLYERVSEKYINSFKKALEAENENSRKN